MGKALILSGRALLTRKEEQALAAADVQVTTSMKFEEDLLSEGHGDFDVIVVDDSLRDADLYETCRRLRAASSALIILLGNEPSWEMWEKSKEIGFDRYYKKPVPPQELGTRIKLAMYELKYRGGTVEKEIVPEVPKKSLEKKAPVLVKTAGFAVDNGPKLAAPRRDEPAGLTPGSWLKWMLEKKGYRVAEKYRVTGRSGSEYVLDLYAEKDDGIISCRVAACVILNEEELNTDVNEVIQFDAAAYDANIRDKIVICVPGLSQEARQFADFQHIKVIESRELDDFSSGKEAPARRA